VLWFTTMDAAPAAPHADDGSVDPGPAARQERVRAALAGGRFSDVRWVGETGSTNADVLDLIRSGEPEGIVVVADHQTAGRGRRGRAWEAPANASLMFTVLLRPRSAVAGLTTMALALAASDTVAELCGVTARLKWPNDLVWPGDGSADDRKLAGILAEAEWPAGATASGGPVRPGPDQRVAVAAGIGINVSWGDRFPDELRETAVALDEITAPQPPPDRADLLVALLRHLERHHSDLGGPSGAETLLGRWRERSATIGRRIRVDLGADDIEGTAVDVTGEGHLVVETLEGDRRTVAVGDVVHLRPLSGG
jgi:BirA family biotin operon repressor/biotin-[acetyl-CoA-carboxylase] ligase